MKGFRIKIAAAALLLLSSALPLSSFAELTLQEPARQYRWIWQLLQEEAALAIPLALVFLWPLPFLALSRSRAGELTRWAEPLFAALSAIIIMALPQALLDIQQIFIWFIPLPSRVEAGGYAVVAANSLYLVGWALSLQGRRKG
jgi:hypothetical protein